MLQHHIRVCALPLTGVLSVGARNAFIVGRVELVAESRGIDAFLTDVDTDGGLSRNPVDIGVDRTAKNIKVVVVLSRRGAFLATRQLIMVFEFVVIYRRRHFPSSALVVDAHIKRSDSMVGFLILIVEFGAVECVCAITLGCYAQLRPDVEAAVVAQRQVGIPLPFLKVAVFGASVRAFVAAADGIGMFPFPVSESHLQPALCPEAAKAAGFHICLDAVCACFFSHNVYGTVERRCAKHAR